MCNFFFFLYNALLGVAKKSEQKNKQTLGGN